MKFILLILFLSIETKAAMFVPDLRVGLNGRTYPIGAQAIGTAGIGVPLWGDTQSWKYGFVRLGLNFATSAVINRIGAEFQVYPISILGLSIGYESGVRNYTPKYVSCQTYECNGRVDRSYFKSVLVAAYRGVILAGMARFEHLSAPNAVKPFFDEMTLLSGISSGENFLTLNPALLYTVDEQWKAGVTSLYSRALQTGGYSHLYGPVASYNVNPEFNVLGGVGLNESRLVRTGWAAFFVLQYTIRPSLNIADLPLRKEPYSSLF